MSKRKPVKTIAISPQLHTDLAMIGKKAQNFGDIVQTMKDLHDNVDEIVVKIQALAGYGRSCHGGNAEVMKTIKKLETEAIALLHPKPTYSMISEEKMRKLIK